MPFWDRQIYKTAVCGGNIVAPLVMAKGFSLIKLCRKFTSFKTIKLVAVVRMSPKKRCGCNKANAYENNYKKIYVYILRSHDKSSKQSPKYTNYNIFIRL